MNIKKIQILRAVAALSIVLLHLIHDLSEKYSIPFLDMLRSWPLGAGVDLFFIISGFVMIISTQKIFGLNGESWHFIAKRCIRVMPAYWTATILLIGVLLAYPAGLNSNHFSFLEIIKSFLFIPYLNGDNVMQPLLKLGWTLNYEMFFYVALSLVFFTKRENAVMILTLCFTCLISIGQLWGPTKYFIFNFWADPIIGEFLIGVWLGVAFIHQWKISRRIAILLGLLGGGMLMILDSKTSGLGDFKRLCVWGLPVALLFYSLVFYQNQENQQTKVGKLFCLLGDSSYVLYLFHPFVMRLLKQIWIKFNFDAPVYAYLYILIALIASSVSSVLLHLYCERPFCDWLRLKILKRI